MVNMGDLPTWLLVGVGAIGVPLAVRQLQLQRRDLKRQGRILERQQATAIGLEYRVVVGGAVGVVPPESTDQVHAAAVRNNSSRPIRNVACKIEADHPSFAATPLDKKLADRIGEFAKVALGAGAMVEQYVLGERRHRLRVLRAGHTGAFVWPFEITTYPGPRIWARFTDDAGLDWEIDPDLHLERLENRAEW